MPVDFAICIEQLRSQSFIDGEYLYYTSSLTFWSWHSLLYLTIYFTIEKKLNSKTDIGCKFIRLNNGGTFAWTFVFSFKLHMKTPLNYMPRNTQSNVQCGNLRHWGRQDLTYIVLSVIFNQAGHKRGAKQVQSQVYNSLKELHKTWRADLSFITLPIKSLGSIIYIYIYIYIHKIYTFSSRRHSIDQKCQ